jgi:hypothetical protein
MKLTRMLAAAVTALSLTVPLACASSASPAAPDSRSDGGARVATPAAHRAGNPSDDHVTLPKRCNPNPAQMPTDPIACKINAFDKSRPTVLLWGDSHAWMYIPALKAAVAGKDVNLVAVVKGTCPPIQFPTKNAPTKLSCYQFNKIGLDLVKQLKKGGKPFRVVLGGSWQRYLEALAHPNQQDDYTIQYAKYFQKGTPRLMKTLGAMHVKTDVIGQTGYPCAATNERNKDDNGKCRMDLLPQCDRGSDPYACDLSRAQMIPAEASTRTWVKDKMKLLTAGKRYISANDRFCDASSCHGFQDPVYTFYDNDHLSQTFSKSLKDLFAKSVPGA